MAIIEPELDKVMKGEDPVNTVKRMIDNLIEASDLAKCPDCETDGNRVFPCAKHQKEMDESDAEQAWREGVDSMFD